MFFLGSLNYLLSLNNRIEHQTFGRLLVLQSIKSCQKQVVVLELQKPGLSIDLHSEIVDSRLRVNLFVFESYSGELKQKLLVKIPVVNEFLSLIANFEYFQTKFELVDGLENFWEVNINFLHLFSLFQVDECLIIPIVLLLHVI